MCTVNELVKVSNRSTSSIFSSSATLKQLIAIVKPYLVEKVIQSIVGQQVKEISIREVKGYGRQKNYLEGYRENEYSLAFVPKVEISVWCEDEHAEHLVHLMVSASRTGRLGDGKILIVPVDGFRTVEI